MNIITRGCKEQSLARQDVAQRCAAKQLRACFWSDDSADPRCSATTEPKRNRELQRAEFQREASKNAPQPPISRSGGAFCGSERTMTMNLNNDRAATYARHSAGVGASQCTTRRSRRAIVGECRAMPQLGHEVTSHVTRATQNNDLRRRGVSSCRVDLLLRNHLRQRDRAAGRDVPQKCPLVRKDMALRPTQENEKDGLEIRPTLTMFA